jgi:hypothetical protein
LVECKNSLIFTVSKLIVMAVLLGEVYRVGHKVAFYTAPNKGRPLAPRNYTIMKRKYGNYITTICFYDTMSMSLHFGFKIRRYRKSWQMFFIHAGVRDNTPIPVSDYKSIIKVLKGIRFDKLQKR